MQIQAYESREIVCIARLIGVVIGCFGHKKKSASVFGKHSFDCSQMRSIFHAKQNQQRRKKRLLD
ncbi:MAG TPA: hypothetical protein DCP92_23075 [Nitrospiraceae bacterium]|jgi:hypothetical protein|nr:hypothetical protein [Nitrospiraceae bacterium]